MKNNQIVILFIIGLLTGVISELLIPQLGDSPIPPNFYIPGVIFGAAIGLYYISLKDISSIFRLYLFILYSTVSYGGAVLVAFASLIILEPFYRIFAYEMYGGLEVVIFGAPIGALLFLSFFTSLVGSIPTPKFKFILLLSTILSISYLIRSDSLSFSLLFIVWQAGVAAALGWATSSQGYKQNAWHLSSGHIVAGILIPLIFIIGFSQFTYPQARDANPDNPPGFFCIRDC